MYFNKMVDCYILFWKLMKKKIKRLIKFKSEKYGRKKIGFVIFLL